MEDFGKIFGDMFNGSKFSSEAELDDVPDIGADSDELVNKVYTMLRGLVKLKLQPTKQGNYALTCDGKTIEIIDNTSIEVKRIYIDYCLNG